MKFKRIFSLMLSAVVLCSFAGCSESDDTPVPIDETKPIEWQGENVPDILNSIRNRVVDNPYYIKDLERHEDFNLTDDTLSNKDIEDLCYLFNLKEVVIGFRSDDIRMTVNDEGEEEPIDLSPLKNLENLEEIYLKNMDADLSDLCKIKTLKEITLWNTNGDLSDLREVDDLESIIIEFSDCKLSELNKVDFNVLWLVDCSVNLDEYEGNSLKLLRLYDLSDFDNNDLEYMIDKCLGKEELVVSIGNCPKITQAKINELDSKYDNLRIVQSKE